MVNDHNNRTYSSLVELLQNQAAEAPDLEVFVFLKNGDTAEEAITFSELDRKARGIAAELQRHGVEGERILLCYPPSLDYITAFFGCLYAGAIAVPSYPPNPSELSQSFSRLKLILANARAKYILTTNQIALLCRFIPGKPTEFKGVQWISTDRIKESWAEKWSPPKLSPESLAFLQYTSGSTGNPKGVMVSHGNLLHNLGWTHKLLNLGKRDRALIWLPPYHDLGLIGGILQPLYSGIACYLMSPLDFLKRPARWLESMSRYKATVSGGPGFAYDLCVRKISAEEKKKYDLSHWRVAFIGAEPVHFSTLRRFVQAMGSQGFQIQAFYPTYGMAETTLVASGGRASRQLVVKNVNASELEKHRVVEVDAADGGSNFGSPGGSNFGSPGGSTSDTRTFVGCGVKLPDQEILVVDPERHTICSKDQVGEFWVCGPSVTQGYWEKEEETDQIFRAKLADSHAGYKNRLFLRTGDLGFIDAEGEVFITGRIKDLIIIRGKNYYPQDIESTVLKSHPSLRPGGTVAFSVPSDSGETLVIVSELSRSLDSKTFRNKDEMALICNTIKQAVLREHEARVEAVVLIKPGLLPKTSSGKLQRRETRAKWIAGELGPVFETSQTSARKDGAQEPADELAIWVIDILSKESAVPASEIHLEDKLSESLCMDSLMLASVYSELTIHFPALEVRDFTKDTRVIDLINVLKKRGGQKPSDAMRTRRKEIPEENYRVELFPEYLALHERFQMIRSAKAENPYFKSHRNPSRDTLIMVSDEDEEMLNYSGYNYVGMSGETRVSAASKKAIDDYGTSASASRLASGETPLHKELESGIARFLGTEDSIVFVAGHPTNVTTIGHVVGAGDMILHDSLSHDSIIQGAKLSGAQRRSFPHNDFRALDAILSKIRPLYRRAMIIVEGVYSMDGDIAHLPELIEIKKRHQAFLFVDEAHSIGVLGKTGRGITEHFGVDPNDVDFLMGTLSKAFASCGGYIAGKKALIEFLKYTAPGFVYSVGLPPSNAAAALESLKLLQEEPQRLSRLRDNSSLFLRLAREAGLDTGPSHATPIVPVILGDSVKCLRLAGALGKLGINVQPILYPAVPENATRLRFFITSCHTKEQIRMTVGTVREELDRL